VKFIYTLRYSLWALMLAAQAVSADIINVAGTAQDFDEMGRTVAAGDFNCDQYDDLAVGVARKDNSKGVTDAGAINIIYGGNGNGGRLSSVSSVQFGQAVVDTPGIIDEFGGVLAVGDFDGDGCDDLAAGMPYKDVGGINNSGQVIVMYGRWDGLNFNSPEIWNQDTSGVAGVVEAYDHFGESLAAGDFNGNGYDDLAIGIPGEGGSGVVYVLNGAPLAGLVTTAAVLLHQDVEGMDGNRESGDLFGMSLASGDFNNNGYADLAIGVPHERWNGLSAAGVVHIVYGSSGFLSGSGSQMWSQDSAGMASVTGENEKFGWSLAAGDFNGNNRDDLAIGVPGEGHVPGSGPYPSPSFEYGAVHVLYSNENGVSADHNRLWRSDDPALGVSENSDFGRSLAAGDFNNDGRDDLAAGAPNNNISGAIIGSVQILYGTANGIAGQSAQLLHQNVANVEDNAEWQDLFGLCLATGDFNNDGRADLAVGVPRESHGEIRGGAAQVSYGAAGVLNMADDQLFIQ
jgi:hypothetical protein